MKKIILSVVSVIVCSTVAFSQETNKHPKINLDSGIFTGREAAYSKFDFSFFKAVSISFGVPMGKSASDLENGINSCFDIFTFDFRPWRNENMFSLGFGFYEDSYKTDDYVQFVDGILTMSPFPKDLKRIFKSQFCIWKLAFPLSYSRDFSQNWTFTVSAIPSFTALACENGIDNGHRMDNMTLLDEGYLDFDFRASISYKWFGLFVDYCPNMILNKTSTMDFDKLSFGMKVNLR